MTMEWKTSQTSFSKHNELMAEFRKAHANVAMVNAPRLDEPARLGSMPPLHAHLNTMNMGGTALHNNDWSLLIPVPKVARYKLVHS